MSSEDTREISAVRKLTISALVMAAYVALTVGLHAISYLPGQVRFATGLYVLAGRFPFLIVPLALANSIANYFGGLGVADIIGGFAAGLLTTLWISRMRGGWPQLIPVVVVPTVVVSSYLYILVKVPFWVVLPSLLLGQTISALTVGSAMLALARRLG